MAFTRLIARAAMLAGGGFAPSEDGGPAQEATLWAISRHAGGSNARCGRCGLQQGCVPSRGHRRPRCH